MKASQILIAALSFAAASVYAENPDPSGQFAVAANGAQTRAAVATQFSQYRADGVNPWATSYNPLKGFRSTRSAAEVRAEYIASRQAVAAMTGEDSGSAYLAARPAAFGGQFAGQPVNAQ